MLPIVFVLNVLLGLAWWSTHRTEYLVFACAFSLLHLDAWILKAELDIIRPLFRSALSIINDVNDQPKYAKLVVLQNISKSFFSVRYFNQINVWMAGVQLSMAVLVHFLRLSDKHHPFFGYNEFLYLLCTFNILLAIDFMSRCMLVTDGRTETVTLKDIDSYESRDVELLPTTHWLKYKVNVVVEDKCELMGF